VKDDEKQFLVEKIRERRQFIRDQKKLPKDQRNQQAIDDAKARIDRMKSWIKGKELKEEKVVRTISKEEFKEQFKKTFELPEADQVMKINNLDELKEAWPHIRGKNIQIDAPADVRAEIMRLYRKEFGNINIPGYKPVKL
jgi:hypothetical protein